MPKYGPSSAWLLVDGYNLISTKLASLRHKVESITDPDFGLGDTSEAHTPVGMSRVELEQTGAFFDTTANSGHAALSASVPTSITATERIVALGFAGQVMGAPFIGLQGAFSFVYEVLANLGRLQKANVDYRITGASNRGVIVQPLAVKTVDWNTKTLGTVVDFTTDPQQRVIPITSNSVANPSVVTTTVPHGLTSGDIVLIAGVTGSTPTINGERVVTVISPTTFSVPVNVTVGGTGGTLVRANSSTGAVGYQQVTALSGFTGFVGKIRDSQDDVTYADLIVFSNVTSAPNAQRVAVAGVIDRYLSYDGDVTGTGSITVFAGLART